MRWIVRHDPNATAVYDRELHYIAVSNRYSEDYDVRKHDIMGKHHYKVFPEMPEKSQDVHRRCLAGAIERDEDGFFVKPDGSVTCNRWECTAWYWADSSIGGIIVYTELITERKRVVMNLIISASEAIGEDTVGQILVETGVRECREEYLRGSRLPEKCPAGRCMYLQVRDNGCGMEEQTKAKLFDPFYTTEFTGRGLGLAAVPGIVRGHKGAIMVESEVGEGPTFTMLFPALAEEPGKVEGNGEPGKAAGWKGTGKVLVAEDDEAMLEVAVAGALRGTALPKGQDTGAALTERV